MDAHIRKVYVPMTETGFYILLCLREECHGYGIVQRVSRDIPQPGQLSFHGITSIPPAYFLKYKTLASSMYSRSRSRMAASALSPL